MHDSKLFCTWPIWEGKHYNMLFFPQNNILKIIAVHCGLCWLCKVSWLSPLLCYSCHPYRHSPASTVSSTKCGNKISIMLSHQIIITREIDALHCSQPKHELQKHQQQIHQIPNTKWDLGICLLPNSNKECSMQMTLKRRNGPDQKIRYQTNFSPIHQARHALHKKWRFWIQQYSTVQ